MWHMNGSTVKWNNATPSIAIHFTSQWIGSVWAFIFKSVRLPWKSILNRHSKFLSGYLFFSLFHLPQNWLKSWLKWYGLSTKYINNMIRMLLPNMWCDSVIYAVRMANKLALELIRIVDNNASNKWLDKFRMNDFERR